MDILEDLLADEPSAPEVRLALELAKEDQHLLGLLVSLRKQRNMTQEQVAEALGVSQATISNFERIGNDPHLSTIRRYCRAIGVLVRHQIDPTPNFDCVSDSLTHLSEGAMLTTPTASAAFGRQRPDIAWPTNATAPAERFLKSLHRHKQDVVSA